MRTISTLSLATFAKIFDSIPNWSLKRFNRLWDLSHRSLRLKNHSNNKIRDRQAHHFCAAFARLF